MTTLLLLSSVASFNWVCRDTVNLHCCRGEKPQVMGLFHWLQILSWDSLYPYKVTRLRLVGRLRGAMKPFQLSSGFVARTRVKTVCVL